MDLSPTPRQVELRDGLSALLAGRDGATWEACVTSEPGYDRGLWSELVSGGWVTVGFPEAAGGSWRGSGGPGGGGGSPGGRARPGALPWRHRAVRAGPSRRTPPRAAGCGTCSPGSAPSRTATGRRSRAGLTGSRPSWPSSRGAGWRLDGAARFVPYARDVDELLVMADVRTGACTRATLFAVAGRTRATATRRATVGGRPPS